MSKRRSPSTSDTPTHRFTPPTPSTTLPTSPITYPLPKSLLTPFLSDASLEHLFSSHGACIKRPIVMLDTETSMSLDESSESYDTVESHLDSLMDEEMGRMVDCGMLNSEEVSDAERLIGLAAVLYAMQNEKYAVLRRLIGTLCLADTDACQIIYDVELTEYLMRRIEADTPDDAVITFDEKTTKELRDIAAQIAERSDIPALKDRTHATQFIRDMLNVPPKKHLTTAQLFEILWTLTNVTAEDACYVIQCMRITPRLLYLVKNHPNVKVVEQTCWLLSNMASEEPIFQKYFKRAELVEIALTRLEKDFETMKRKELSALRTMMWLIANLLSVKSQSKATFDALRRVNRIVLRLFDDEDISTETFKYAFQCYRSVSSIDSEAVTTFLFEDELLQRMIGFVDDTPNHMEDDEDYLEAVQSCLYVLGNIASNCSSTHTELLVDFGLVKALVDILRPNEDNYKIIAKDILWILSNMLTDSLKACIALWTSKVGISDIFVQCLQCEGKVRSEASFVLKNSLTSDLGTKRHIAHRFVAPLVEALYWERSLEEKNTYIHLLGNVMQLGASQKSESPMMREFLKNDLALLGRLDVLQHSKYHPLTVKVRLLVHTFVDPYILETQVD